MFLVPMTRRTSDWVRSFDRLFDESFDRLFADRACAQTALPRSPALDVAETEQAYTVTLDLPGVAKDDVKVSIEGRRVSIEAQASKQRRAQGRRPCAGARTCPVELRTQLCAAGAKSIRSAPPPSSTTAC